MALKQPLVLNNGQIEQLQAGDTIPGGAVNIKQTEVDFGATPVADAVFTIVDVDVTNTSQIIATVAYEAPTGKDLDELQMDELIIMCGNGVGTFDMYIKSADGSYLADKFKINYLIG